MAAACGENSGHDRLGLDVAQSIPTHGRLTTLAKARAYVEAFGRTQIVR